MNKYLAAACGAALVITAGFAAAQTPTPDRQGESSTQSANPDMDKKGKSQQNQPNQGTVGKGTPMLNPTPGTDSPGGESSTDSAKPKQR